MRILVLGGDGMLGHTLLGFLGKRHDVSCTVRQKLSEYAEFNMFTSQNTFAQIDVLRLQDVNAVLEEFMPEVVINCVGIVKQQATAKESIPSIEINALLPHKLSVLCREIGAKLIHISTDCVFNGKRGNYKETDISDAEDLYGKTKYLGEVHEDNCLTLRTSIIGRELWRKKSLLEWFLAQEGAVKGFENAVFSGFTTLELARIIEMLLVDYPAASGVYQVSSEPINKYQLLVLFRSLLGHNIDITSETDFHCDRSLDSNRFRKQFNYKPPSWEAMIEELSIIN